MLENSLHASVDAISREIRFMSVNPGFVEFDGSFQVMLFHIPKLISGADISLKSVDIVYGFNPDDPSISYRTVMSLADVNDDCYIFQWTIPFAFFAEKRWAYFQVRIRTVSGTTVTSQWSTKLKKVYVTPGLTGGEEEYTQAQQDVIAALNSRVTALESANLQIDNEPTENSSKLVKSGGVWSAINDVYDAVETKAEEDKLDEFATIKQITGGTVLTPWASGRYKTSSSTGIGDLVSFELKPEYVYTMTECSPGDEFYIHLYGGAGICRGYFFCDENMICLSRMTVASTEITSVIKAPANAKYLILNNYLGTSDKKGLPSGYYAYTGNVPLRSVKETLDLLAKNVVYEFDGFVVRNVNSSSGNLVSADDRVISKTLLPLDKIYKVVSDKDNIKFFCYASDQTYRGTIDWPNAYYDSATDASTILAKYPTTAYLRIRFGSSTDVITLADIPNRGIKIYLFRNSPGLVTRESLRRYENEAGVFISDGSKDLSFSIVIPFNGDYRNQIFTCTAKYEQGDGVAGVPTIQLMTGTGLNGSTKYILGGKGQLETKQWRTVRYPGDETAVTVKFTVPIGVTLTIQDFYNEYSDRIERVPNGIRINSHRGFPMTPQDTLPGLNVAVKAGACAMIEIPKRLSDGTWIFYHDDTLKYDKTYITQADGAALSSDKYNDVPWSTIKFKDANSWNWGGTNPLYAGTKPMTMEQFFTICGKTGIMPMLSIHPWPSGDELEEIKAIARKCGVLSKLGIKCPTSHITDAYSVFGNDIESYTIDVSSSAAERSDIENAITKMNSLAGCTVRRVIELFASTAYEAYFGETQFDAFGLISAKGYGCAIAQQHGEYHPTDPGGSDSVLIWGSDFDYWISKGVNEFTFEYHTSFGLNW